MYLNNHYFFVQKMHMLNLRRFLTTKQVYVTGLSPRIQDQDVLNHRLFKNAESVELIQRENKQQQLMGHNAIITFPEEEDKKRVLVESHYYAQWSRSTIFGHNLFPNYRKF